MRFRQAVALVLCTVLSGAPAAFAAPADPAAGHIQALIPDASRNEKPAQLKEELAANDLLRTGPSGRMRAGLSDGSILSLGSSSQMRVTRHETASQQTELELSVGKLRSKVVKVTQSGGKFEVKTPNAVIGVVGTDFYVSYVDSQTTVICYKGVVTVSAIAGAAAASSPAGATGAAQATRLTAGQKAVVSGLSAGSIAAAASSAELTASMQETETSGAGSAAGSSAATASHHLGKWTWITIGAVAVAGVVIGIVATRGGSNIQRKGTP